jgi:hypothetical protein
MRWHDTALEMPLKRRHAAALQILPVATTSQDAILHMALPRCKPNSMPYLSAIHTILFIIPACFARGSERSITGPRSHCWRYIQLRADS